MHIRKFRNKLVIGAASLLAMMTAGCSMVTDAPEACPAQLRVRFVYEIGRASCRERVWYLV